MAFPEVIALKYRPLSRSQSAIEKLIDTLILWVDSGSAIMMKEDTADRWSAGLEDRAGARVAVSSVMGVDATDENASRA